jgi:hypothetical protein
MSEPAEEQVVLTQYTIYERPKDHPTAFVVRQWHIVRGRDRPVAGVMAVVETLGEARALVPRGLINVGTTTTP